MGMCWNCGRENSGHTCYSCGFEVIHRERDEHECDCDPGACGHGNWWRCDKCSEPVHVDEAKWHEEDQKSYCPSCFENIVHAEKHGRAIDIWEAKNVE